MRRGAWILCFLSVGVQFVIPVNVDGLACRNEHSDVGFCSTPWDCRRIKGVRIGHCGPPSGGRICCLKLPCSGDRRPRPLIKFRVKRRSLPWDEFDSRGLSCGIRQERDRQIIGGRTITESQRHPWMLSLWQRNSTSKLLRDFFPICGGGLITVRHALTAGHCVNSFPDEPEKYFVLGGSVINELPLDSSNSRTKIMGVRRILVHPGFDSLKLENDIALLSLIKPITFRPDLSPICLPYPQDDNVRDFVTISGWGCVSERCGQREVPTMLKETVLPVVPNKVAMCWFMTDSIKQGREEYIPDKLFLVGGDSSGLRSTCRGDSGSPVSRPRPSDGRIELVGLVSWSKGCGRKFRPSVWTNVRNYIHWIRQNLD